MEEDRECDDCGELESISGVEHELYTEDGIEETLCSCCISLRQR